MKNIFLLILFLNIFSLNSQAQTTTIPDANFETKLIALGIDSDGLVNGQILNSDAAGVTVLDVSNSTINDLTGIAAFNSLITLICTNNQLINLNISSNINLEFLHCQDNQLTNINTSNNPNLVRLGYANNQLTNLDLSNNPNLSHLYCTNNQITNLDLSNNPNLRLMDCGDNQLTTLDLSNNLNLRTLYCGNNQLTNINTSNNINLNHFVCQNNQLAGLNLSNNTNLKHLHCTENQINNLNFRNNSTLERLYCTNNQLTNLDFSNNPNLEILNCKNNQLTNLNLSNNPNLSELYCDNNQLTNLDFSNNPNLIKLFCENNQLTNVELSNNLLLSQLVVTSNYLKYINIKNTSLLYFYTDNNLPNLVICLDDSIAASNNYNWSNNGFNWSKDPTTTYTETCPNTTLVGYVKSDINNNCQIDSLEPSVKKVIIQISSTTDTIYKVTNTLGKYSTELGPRTYTLSIFTPNPYLNYCINPQSTSIDSLNDLDTINWALQTTHYCPYLTTSISAPFLRMTGGGSSYTVNYCNDGTAAAYGAYIEVSLDSFLTVTGTGLPIVNQLGNVYTFNLDTLNIGECGSFNIHVIVDTSAQLGQVHCSEVHIYPDSLCNNTWTGPIIEADAICNNDTITFELRNVGSSMLTPSNYLVIEDNLVMYTGPYTLGAGFNTTVQVPAQIGKSYRIEAQQAIGFPAVLGPNIAYANMQNCNGPSVTLNTPLLYYNGNPSPWIDLDCQASIAAYDPNDKNAQQIGYGSQNYIERGTPLDYKVRFQNTGNDTAFHVTILDTISTHLDLGTLQMKVASHNYTWQIVNGHTLRVDFPNIKLVDSLTNEPLSHGFFRYEIQQKPNLPLGTAINNEAAIYFDYNPPIFTNTTLHTIGENYIPIILNLEEAWVEEMQVHIYPNPTAGLVYIEQLLGKGTQIKVLDNLGRVVLQQNANDRQTTVDLNHLPQGIYYIHIQQDKQVSTHKVIKH